MPGREDSRGIPGVPGRPEEKRHKRVDTPSGPPYKPASQTGGAERNGAGRSGKKSSCTSLDGKGCAGGGALFWVLIVGAHLVLILDAFWGSVLCHCLGSYGLGH